MEERLVCANVNGEEYFEVVSANNSYEKIAQKAIRHFNIKGTKEGETIKVKMFNCSTFNGNIIQNFSRFVDVPLSYQTTQTEYEAKRDELLKEVPLQFREAMSDKAWEDGHSSGYDEVLICLKDLVDAFKPCIEAYRVRVSIEGK